MKRAHMYNSKKRKKDERKEENKRKMCRRHFDDLLDVGRRGGKITS